VPELPTIRGREVAGVVGAARGAAKLEQVRDLGADVAVDYGARGWGDTVRDALGGREVTPSRWMASSGSWGAPRSSSWGRAAGSSSSVGPPAR
jgi:hypothetical protein